MKKIASVRSVQPEEAGLCRLIDDFLEGSFFDELPFKR